jgi:DNA-binding transcriptional LysR family regulator
LRLEEYKGPELAAGQIAACVTLLFLDWNPEDAGALVRIPAPVSWRRAAERISEALLPSVVAGLGIADLPDFIVGDAIASGEVEVILKG